jgi:protein phosphatase/serine/threonine-protein phosphatase Stp1
MTAPHFVFRSAGMTHPGTIRERNEDAWIERPVLGLWAIADGLGGHASGDQASRLLVDRLGRIETDDARVLLAAVQTHVSDANQDLLRIAADSGSTVASTIVVLLTAAGHYACLWAGDSRAYLLREGRMQRITKDHSLVQEMFDGGLITEAEMETHAQRHILTRAVGGEDVLVLDKITAPVQRGDRFLLCSDGLTRAIAENEIAAALALAIETVPSRLIALALERQCSDNVTVIAIEAAAG